jgi:hypothetical protein
MPHEFGLRPLAIKAQAAVDWLLDKSPPPGGSVQETEALNDAT